jgi:hypothetical protein
MTQYAAQLLGVNRHLFFYVQFQKVVLKQVPEATSLCQSSKIPCKIPPRPRRGVAENDTKL